jgi:hypothetical protein
MAAKKKPAKKAASKANTKVTKVMHEWKTGTLHSGKGGPVVKSRKQAIAIALSEQAQTKKKKK